MAIDPGSGPATTPSGSTPTSPGLQDDIRQAPGAIDLQACMISNFDGSEQQDIKLQLIEFSVYESIFSDHIRADLSFSDALALPTRMPIVGEETISLSFKTPKQNEETGEDYDTCSYELAVVEMKKARWEGIRNGVYLLQCVSPYRIANLMSVVQKPYGPQPISKTVEDIISETLEASVEVEETAGDHHFVMPSLSPFQCMAMLCDEAISSDSPVSNFVFFEDMKGFKFKSIETMIANGKQKVDQVYFTTPQSLSIEPGHPNRRATTQQQPQTQKNPEEWYFVRALQMDTQFNIEKAIANGLYDNQVYWVDPLLQQYESQKCGEDDHFNYVKNFGLFQHIAKTDGSPLASEKATHGQGIGQSHIRFLFGSPNQNWATHQMTPRMRHSQLNYGISSIEQFGFIRAVLTVPGDSDRRPGHTIQFDLHELGATDDVIGELNEYLSGNYLVTAVRHMYSPQTGYYTVMEIVKNVYETEIKNADGGTPSRGNGDFGFNNITRTIG